MAKQRVAIIGAGAAGLSMCRCLAEEPQIEFVAFEKTDKVGGIWRYTKEEKDESYQWHTPMYKNLRTNIPTQVMAYPGFPFPKHVPSFPDHETVTKYVEDYAEHFGLLKYIKLQHEVVSVKPLQHQEQLMWDVIVKDLKNGRNIQKVFNAVVVCNGHFGDPSYPQVPGLDSFPGSIIHSLSYKEPEGYKGQTVVVLGAGSSGLDICLEVSKFAKKVFFVHKEETPPSKFPEIVEQVIGTLTAFFSDGSVEFNGELKRPADAVIFCTGYNYSFPFLTPECKIEVKDNRVTSLYKHVFNTAFPSLSFIGLCLRLCPFPTFAVQSQWVTAVLAGRKTLPDRDEMKEDEEMDYQEKMKAGLAPNKSHVLGNERQFEYNNELARLAGVDASYTPAIHSLCYHISAIRKKQLTTYRDTNYALTDGGFYEVKSES